MPLDLPNQTQFRLDNSQATSQAGQSDAGVQSPFSSASSSSLIDDAKQAAERLEKANQELKSLLKQREEMEARAILGGHGFAGQVTKQKTKDEEIMEGAKELATSLGIKIKKYGN